MDYGHNTVVTDDTDLGPIIQRLLGELDVATVHVRTLAPQCFLYAVAARPPGHASSPASGCRPGGCDG